MRSHLLSWVKLLLLSGIGLVFVVLLTIVALVYSPVGPELMVWGAQKFFPNLSVAQIDGSVGSGFTLHDVAYSDARSQFNLEAESISATPDLACLLQSAICFDKLHTNGVVLKLRSTTQVNSSSSSASEKLSIPWPLKVERLQFDDISISREDSSLHWQSLVSGVNMVSNELTLAPTHWQGLTITFPAVAGSVAMASANSPGAPVFNRLILADILLPLDFNIPDLSLRDVQIHQDKTRYTIDNLDIGGTTRNSNIDLRKLHMKSSEAEVSARGHVALQGDYPLAINFEGRYLKAPLKGQVIRGNLTGSLADLGLTALAEGPFKTNLISRILLTRDNLPFELKARNSSGYWPLSGPAQYVLNGDILTGEGDLNHYSFEFKGLLRGTNVPDLSASLQGKGTQTEVTLTAMELVSAASYVRGRLHADWRQDVTLAAQLDLENFMPELLFRKVPGTISGEANLNATIYEDGGWNIDLSQLDITGLIKDYPLAVKGQVTARSAATDLGFSGSTPQLVIQHGANQIRLDGSLADTLNMSMGVNFTDLSKSIDGAAGQVSGTMQLSGTPESPELDLNLVGEQLQWVDLLRADSLALKGSISSISKQQGTFHMTLRSSVIQNQSIDSLQLHFDGSVADHHATLAVVTPLGQGMASLHGGFQQALSQWVGELTDMQLTHDNETLALQDPASIIADFSHREVRLGRHCWSLAGALICLTEPTALSAGNVSAALLLKSLSLNTLEKWLPEVPFSGEGTLDGTAHIHWLTGQDPFIEGTFTIAKGRVTSREIPALILPWNSIRVEGQLKNGTLTSFLAADLTDNGRVSLRADIADIKAKEKQLQGALILDQINIDFLKPLLGDNGDGYALLNSDLRLSGHLLQPQVLGTLTVSDMRASGDVFPVAVKQGAIKLDFNGYAIVLSGSIQTQDGELNLSGDADWQDLSQWRVNSHISAKGLDVNVPPMVRLKVIPDINLNLLPGLARITGKVQIPAGLIEVEDLPESAVAVSKDQVIVEAAGKPVQRQSLPLTVDTNIEVQIGDQLRISAFGLKGRLHGLLKIVQKDKAPFVSGDVNILDGTYRSLGQDLIIQKGNVLFNGPVSKPYVAITAIRNPDNIEDEVTAGLKVSGPADAPQMTVFSDPAMAQANALSYLLRGRNLGADGGDNAMTMTLIGLSLSQSGRIVGDIGQAVGIQDLQLDTAGSGNNSQVTVSGYVLPGLQVKYGVGLFNSVGEFTLRYRMIKNLYVEAVSGMSSAVDLIYQFEF